MANSSGFQKLLAVSPWVEVAVRHLYWKNATAISKVQKVVRPASRKRSATPAAVMPGSFDRILTYLSEQGVGLGTLLVVHSAYGRLRRTGLGPVQIVEGLCGLVGTEGTLAMPAIPGFKSDATGSDYLGRDVSNLLFEYHVQDSPIKTGVLPQILHNMPGSIRSLHPINTMVARGAAALPMMAHNLVDESSLPCGPGSSWDFCAKQDAFVVGLGIDLTHSLTMIHVAEDRKRSTWPVQPWYRDKRFSIDDGRSRREIILQERHPRWGTLHFAERTLSKDLLEKGILKTAVVDGITVEVLRAGKLIEFLDSMNGSGYPYYGIRRHLAR